MILPGIGGFLLGKYIVDRRAAAATAFILGLATGIIAGLGAAPLLYPIYTGFGDGPVIPEYRELVIYFIITQYPMFSEIYDIFGTGPVWVPFIMASLGLASSLIGFVYARRGVIQISDWTEQM
jgi:hypothetical protein